MNRFIQLHLLTSYPPSNLNRDDLGRPKTAVMGGAERLRVSSQCLKRTWRTSELFQSALAGHIGTRTKLLGEGIEEKLLAGGIGEKDAKAWATQIAGQFGKCKKDKVELEQLVHVSQQERSGIEELVSRLLVEQRAPEDEELKLLRSDNEAVDIALFGRMLASSPQHNVEAACQVAHALSVHSVTVEDDYFTAVDDLNTKDPGAAHIGESSLGAAVFYSYVCIDTEQLARNLNGNDELVTKTIKALVEAAIKVAPKAKQNSFGSRAHAHFALVEKGNEQPRSLSVAFLKPVSGYDYATEASARLMQQRENFNKVYNDCASGGFDYFDVMKGEGSLEDMLVFLTEF